MRKTPIAYVGVAAALFGVAVVMLHAVTGENCWGTLQQAKIDESNSCPPFTLNIKKCPPTGGTIYEPITCSFWLSYIFIGIASILAGASLFVFGQLRHSILRVSNRG